jgi:protein-S-isoprenylcysteine O-methyltransferase Ste14
MNPWQQWGFTAESWRGQRGEYYVLLQAVLMVGFVVLPRYSPTSWMPSTPLRYGLGAIALGIALFAVVLLGKGLMDLGQNLTPLPYPKEDGTLVQTGVYGLVRHCLYSGIILGAIAYSLWSFSLSHFLAATVLFVFFDIKARQEEQWLSAKFTEYAEYRQRVKKLIPWVY